MSSCCTVIGSKWWHEVYEVLAFSQLLEIPLCVATFLRFCYLVSDLNVSQTTVISLPITRLVGQSRCTATKLTLNISTVNQMSLHQHLPTPNIFCMNNIFVHLHQQTLQRGYFHQNPLCRQASAPTQEPFTPTSPGPFHQTTRKRQHGYQRPFHLANGYISGAARATDSCWGNCKSPQYFWTIGVDNWGLKSSRKVADFAEMKRKSKLTVLSS